MKILLLLICFFISFSQAENLKKVSLQLKWKYQFQFAGFIAAYEKGFYKDIGLDVTLKEFGNDTNILQDVRDEKTDFAISDSALVYDALKGEPITALMAVFQHSPFMLVGLNNGEIKTLKDLDNKIIALDEGTDGISIKAMLKTKNIEYKKHMPVFSLDKLLAGEIDMMSSYISNEPYIAKLMGLEIKTFLPQDYGFEGYGDILFTSNKMLKNNPELVNHFYRASLEGWKYAFTHVDELVDIIFNKYNSLGKSKRALLYEAKILHKLSNYGNNFGSINKEKIKSIAQQFNLVKNEHNKLEILDNFIYSLNNLQENKKTVNVLLGFDKPPFIFGQASSKGIESDLLREAFSYINYNVNILQGKKSEQEIVLHQKNEIDAVATISQKNDNLFYSDTFTVYENYVITRKSDNIKIDSLEDLKNINFVTWKNAYHDLREEFDRLYNPTDGKYPNSYHDTLTQIDDAKMFFAKKVDAIIVDKTIFNWHKLYFKNSEEYVFHNVLRTKKKYPVTFRDKKLRDKFNKGLSYLKHSGRYDEIIKFYETQDVKQLMTLTSLLSDISSKYIFEQRKDELLKILKKFMIHPDIKAISIRNKNKQYYYTNLVRKANGITEDMSFVDEDLQKIASKIYYKTEFDLLNLGELSIYYRKDYKTKNGKVIPHDNIFNELALEDYERIRGYYKKYKINNDISVSLTQEEINYLNKHKTITVHNENSWAPYNYIKDNKANGFSIDYMELLARKLNINIKYVQGYSWSDFLNLLKQEKIDVIANIAKNKNREKYVNFTSPYIQSKKAIFSNIPDIKSLSDLKGKSIALPKQFYTQNYLEKNYPSIKIKIYKDTTESLYAVINKEADALIENFAVVNSLMQKNGLHIPYVTLNDDKELISDLHIGVRKSQVILRDILEKAKQAVTEEEFIHLEHKWFGINKDNINIFTSKELEYIKKKKNINVCFHNQQDPWVINEKDSITGYTIEFLKYITKKSTLDFNFIETKNVRDHFAKIKNGTCDVSPVIVTKPNRFNFLNPTIPFIKDNIVLVTKINEPFAGDLNTLKNKKIGIHKGKKSLIQYVKSIYPNINLVEVDDLDLDKIVQGDFYGYISASYKMSYMIYPKYINKLKIMTKIGDKKIHGSFGISTREPLLLDIFNKSLNNISALEKQEIANAWVSVEVEKHFDYELFIQFILVFMIIFIILGISYIKQKKLKDRIQLLNNSLEQRVKDEVQKNREKDKVMFRQSRLAQMGEVISMIAHQWRQPLNSLSLLNQTILLKYDREKLNDEAIEFFRVHSKKQIHEMSKTIDDFKDFFKPQKIKKEFLLNEVIDNLFDIVKPIYTRSNVNININIDQEHYIMGYKNELGQAVLNILNNAKDALVEKNIEKKEVNITVKKYDGKINIVISDNAGGIPGEYKENIFDPYFSTKGDKNGTGLGLYMTKMIVEDHMDGKITVKNNHVGAVFTIILEIQNRVEDEKNNVSK